MSHSLAMACTWQGGVVHRHSKSTFARPSLGAPRNQLRLEIGRRFGLAKTLGLDWFSLVYSPQRRQTDRIVPQCPQTPKAASPESTLRPGRTNTPTAWRPATARMAPVAWGRCPLCQLLDVGGSSRPEVRCWPSRWLTVRQNQHATLTFTSTSMMWHPMHLQDHAFQMINYLDVALPQHLSPGVRHDDSLQYER